MHLVGNSNVLIGLPIATPLLSSTAQIVMQLTAAQVVQLGKSVNQFLSISVF
jgi:hypothetical protein